MKTGAYQFQVTSDIKLNMEAIRRGIALAAKEKVRLLVFPECALTGYPAGEARSSDVDFQALDSGFAEMQALSDQHGMYLLAGSVTKENNACYNSALLFKPGGIEATAYHKRALWGWDLHNFTEGSPGGIWEIDEVKIGVRICFEVRFPEFFRELYRANADLAIILFNDITETDDLKRYELIKAHLLTRAAENVCTVVSVNSASPYQAAPTAVIDQNVEVKAELSRHREDLLLYDYQTPELSFSARGRKAVSDKLSSKGHLPL